MKQTQQQRVMAQRMGVEPVQTGRVTHRGPLMKLGGPPAAKTTQQDRAETRDAMARRMGAARTFEVRVTRGPTSQVGTQRLTLHQIREARAAGAVVRVIR